MLTFHNWRVDRSGAGIRVTGVAVFSRDDHKLDHRMSADNVRFGIDRELYAYDRKGNQLALLSRLNYDERHDYAERT